MQVHCRSLLLASPGQPNVRVTAGLQIHTLRTQPAKAAPLGSPVVARWRRGDVEFASCERKTSVPPRFFQRHTPKTATFSTLRGALLLMFTP